MYPPNDGLLSDADSDDEEGVSANHLSGPQLSAAAEYRIDYGNSISDSSDDDTSPVEEAIVESSEVRASDMSLSDLRSFKLSACFAYIDSVALLQKTGEEN